MLTEEARQGLTSILEISDPKDVMLLELRLVSGMPRSKSLSEAIETVLEITQKPSQVLCQKVIKKETIVTYLEGIGIRVLKEQSKNSCIRICMEKWNVYDDKFWEKKKSREKHEKMNSLLQNLDSIRRRNSMVSIGEEEEEAITIFADPADFELSSSSSQDCLYVGELPSSDKIEKRCELSSLPPESSKNVSFDDLFGAASSGCYSSAPQAESNELISVSKSTNNSSVSVPRENQSLSHLAFSPKAKHFSSRGDDFSPRVIPTESFALKESKFSGSQCLPEVHQTSASVAGDERGSASALPVTSVNPTCVRKEKREMPKVTQASISSAESYTKKSDVVLSSKTEHFSPASSPRMIPTEQPTYESQGFSASQSLHVDNQPSVSAAGDELPSVSAPPAISTVRPMLVCKEELESPEKTQTSTTKLFDRSFDISNLIPSTLSSDPTELLDDRLEINEANRNAVTGLSNSCGLKRQFISSSAKSQEPLSSRENIHPSTSLSKKQENYNRALLSPQTPGFSLLFHAGNQYSSSPEKHESISEASYANRLTLPSYPEENTYCTCSGSSNRPTLLSNFLGRKEQHSSSPSKEESFLPFRRNTSESDVFLKPKASKEKYISPPSPKERSLSPRTNARELGVLSNTQGYKRQHLSRLSEETRSSFFQEKLPVCKGRHVTSTSIGERDPPLRTERKETDVLSMVRGCEREHHASPLAAECESDGSSKPQAFKKRNLSSHSLKVCPPLFAKESEWHVSSGTQNFKELHVSPTPAEECALFLCTKKNGSDGWSLLKVLKEPHPSVSPNESFLFSYTNESEFDVSPEQRDSRRHVSSPPRIQSAQSLHTGRSEVSSKLQNCKRRHLSSPSREDSVEPLHTSTSEVSSQLQNCKRRHLSSLSREESVELLHTSKSDVTSKSQNFKRRQLSSPSREEHAEDLYSSRSEVTLKRQNFKKRHLSSEARENLLFPTVHTNTNQLSVKSKSQDFKKRLSLPVKVASSKKNKPQSTLLSKLFNNVSDFSKTSTERPIFTSDRCTKGKKPTSSLNEGSSVFHGSRHKSTFASKQIGHTRPTLSGNRTPMTTSKKVNSKGRKFFPRLENEKGNSFSKVIIRESPSSQTSTFTSDHQLSQNYMVQLPSSPIKAEPSQVNRFSSKSANNASVSSKRKGSRSILPPKSKKPTSSPNEEASNVHRSRHQSTLSPKQLDHSRAALNGDQTQPTSFKKVNCKRRKALPRLENEKGSLVSEVREPPNSQPSAVTPEHSHTDHLLPLSDTEKAIEPNSRSSSVPQELLSGKEVTSSELPGCTTDVSDDDESASVSLQDTASPPSSETSSWSWCTVS